ncbi:MAG: type II toxin-antitoxin system VapC family toxin [Propioniciclava sp.]|uniref:type II toxin-antitoxin system VapC family toxin n=1 Tax=Propioniciclava sp. TaxID=2038686 RepID=UPI0039E37D13
MTAYLLDTHVIVWMATEPKRIPRKLRSALARAEHLHVSPASVYEIVQLVRLGRLPSAASILARWDELVEAMMAAELPLTAEAMARAGSMPWAHRDPFDRMLVAQSQLGGFTLVTKDATILAFPEVNCAPWT